MITVGYTQQFIRAYDSLQAPLKEEIKEKIQLFTDRENHQRLKVHKLHGKMAGRWSFSVNYKIRVVFVYVGKGKNTVSLIIVGDHSIYD